MAENVRRAHLHTPHAHPGNLVDPLLYLSSVEAGWDGLVAQAFHEPTERAGWITTATSDVTLVVFMGGAMQFAHRPLHRAWQEVCMKSGDLMLRPGGQTTFEVRWKNLSSTPTQTLHLRVGNEVLTRAAAELDSGDPARIALVGRTGFQDPLLTQIGLAVWRELAQPAPAGKLYAQTAAQFLAMHLLRHYSTLPLSREPAHQLTVPQLRRVQAFIQAHLSVGLSLVTLADQTGFSPYHFARLFRQATGASPHQYVLQQRIAHAQRLLAEATTSLAEIALACGFANQSHFTQVFKRQLGITPRAYQRERTNRAGF